MEKLLIKGNEALAEGAVRGGCRFLPDTLSPHSPKFWNGWHGGFRK